MKALAKKHLAWLAPALAALWAISSLPAPRRADGADLAGFASLPALHEGRVKPLDTVARTILLSLRGKQTVRTSGRTIGAAEWLLDMGSRPNVADAYEVFEIDDPDVLGVAGVGATDRRRFSMRELIPALPEIAAQAERAEGVPEGERTRFQAAILALNRRLMAYRSLQHTLGPGDTGDFGKDLEGYRRALGPGVAAVRRHRQGGGFDDGALAAVGEYFRRWQLMASVAVCRVIPPGDGEPADAWLGTGEALLDGLRTGEIDPHAFRWAAILDGWRRGDAQAFNAAVAAEHRWLADHRPGTARGASAETLFNRAAPFYAGMVLYVLALLVAFAAWLVWPRVLALTAFRIMALAWVVHTAGLAVRILLQGRPPVTNLYSSAVFVGWASAGLALELERRVRNGLGVVVGSLVGFATLIIAHHLAAQGDSMEMMRAVLDSNFWLATHVVTVTIGYAATYLAGALAIAYILRGVLTRGLGAAEAESLSASVYGVIAFALFFSFVGTVLGGIWADQSWGRFWGWDPKENGALLIVFWNAIILHVRRRYVTDRGVMVMAVFGNVITTCSWFGVNMLGIGLHSYGFMDRAFVWLAAFVATQVAVIGIGFIPLRRWRSRIAESPAMAGAGRED